MPVSIHASMHPCLCSLFFFKTMVAFLGSASILESAMSKLLKWRSDDDDKLYSHIAAVDDVYSVHKCWHTQSRSPESASNIFRVLGVSTDYREWARCFAQTYNHISLSLGTGALCEEGGNGVHENHKLSAAMMTESRASNAIVGGSALTVTKRVLASISLEGPGRQVSTHGVEGQLLQCLAG